MLRYLHNFILEEKIKQKNRKIQKTTKHLSCFFLYFCFIFFENKVMQVTKKVDGSFLNVGKILYEVKKVSAHENMKKYLYIE